MIKSLLRMAAIGALLVWGLPAHAYDIKEAGVEQGVVKFESNSTYTNENANNRYEYKSELEASIGITDFFKFHVGLKYEEEEDQSSYHLETVGAGFTLELLDPVTNPVGLAAYGGIYHNRRTVDNYFALGGIAETRVQQVTVRGNAFYIGDVSERESFDGVKYAYQLRYDITDKYALGIEGFGVEKDFDNPLQKDESKHKVGPVFYYKCDVFKELALDTFFPAFAEMDTKGNVGVLFGTNEQTPDVTIKWNTDFYF